MKEVEKRCSVISWSMPMLSYSHVLIMLIILLTLYSITLLHRRLTGITRCAKKKKKKKKRWEREGTDTESYQGLRLPTFEISVVRVMHRGIIAVGRSCIRARQISFPY